ncbi:MAG: hypothetical protein ACI9O4_001498 [Chitinophagales bacterium]
MPCGIYSGTYRGNIQSPIAGLDTIFTNTQTIITITEGLNYSVNLSFDLSGFFGSPLGTQFINFDQAYWEDSTIVGQAMLSGGLIRTYFELEATNRFQCELGRVRNP